MGCTLKWWRDWGICNERSLWECGLFSLEKWRLRGDLINVYKYLMVRTEGDGARLFSVMSSYRAKGIWNWKHKLKTIKLHLNTRKHFFIVWVIKHWNRLPREIVETSSWEIFRTSVSMVLRNLLELTLIEQQDWTRWSQNVPTKLNEFACEPDLLHILFKLCIQEIAK